MALNQCDMKMAVTSLGPKSHILLVLPKCVAHIHNFLNAVFLLEVNEIKMLFPTSLQVHGLDHSSHSTSELSGQLSRNRLDWS